MIVQTLLNAVSATGAGDTVEPVQEADSIRDLPYQIAGTFVGTVDIEVSLNGTDWFALVSTTAFPTAGTIPYFPYVRSNVSAYTSGSVSVWIGY